MADEADEPVVDTTPYGYGKDDSVTDVTENAAVTHHVWTHGDVSIPYTARAGHLVTTGQLSAEPAAKIFYVAFTADGVAATERPVTFFYNGGPGSSSVFLLLGSFGPRRIRTSLPAFTPPAPYAMEDNGDSLLDHSDLVFINPVGTGYSGAVAPRTNKDFWGVDKDAGSIRQFVKRFLTVYDRWNSPKFLFGESYGTPRTCVLTWLLHEDGVDLNGVVLQSSILDYSQASNAVGLLPTLAADAWYHQKVGLSPYPPDLPPFTDDVIRFDREKYAATKAAFALGTPPDPEVLQYLSDILGIPATTLEQWGLDPSIGFGSLYLTTLLQDQGLAVGAYDGRVTASDTGIAGSVDPNSGGNDPTMTAVGGVYTALWNVYLNDELKFTATSPFLDLNDQAFLNWDFSHIDPRGVDVGGRDTLYTAGDLAASMALNPYLRVFSANGYYDAVTPFFQTILNFENMPLDDADARKNLEVHNYPSGHMIYLDNPSRTAMKADLAPFYEKATTPPAVDTTKAKALPAQARRYASPYRRGFLQTPY